MGIRWLNPEPASAITPWNFPLLLLMIKVAPALLAGNTVVAKPAPTTPLTTLLFGELCAEILPPGVFNVIVDQNDLGGYLTQHPDVAKVAFTGSTATGKKVMASVAGTIKRVTLELGGNDAAIVLDGAGCYYRAEPLHKPTAHRAVRCDATVWPGGTLVAELCLPLVAAVGLSTATAL